MPFSVRPTIFGAAAISSIYIRGKEYVSQVHFENVYRYSAIEPELDGGLLEDVLAVINQETLVHSIPIFPVFKTSFQQQVLEAIQSISYGSTNSYQEIAKQMGHPTSHRAVANACGTNSVAVLIPCHRVIRSDGTIGGYRWGTEIKKKLLELESINLSHV